MSAISLRFSPSRLLPLASFFRFLDLKLGSEIITYFALLNKVAGVYGLLAVFFGGTLAQLSLYLYSIGSIILCAWGLRQIAHEHPNKTLTYAHLYALDHVLSTLWTVFFAVQWYVYEPHDGRRVANSQAQKEILEGLDRQKVGMDNPNHSGGGVLGDSQAEIARKALSVWRDERAFATTVLVLGWLLKIYFILTLYSFALHLRRGTFKQLLANQLAKKQSGRRTNSVANGYAYSHLRNTSTASTVAGGARGGPGETVWATEDEEAGGDLGNDDIDAQIQALEESSGQVSSSRRASEPATRRDQGTSAGAARKGGDAL